MGDYRKLDVYNLACEFSDRVNAVVERLPAKVRTKKGDQLARAADSIHENIAEGCGLNSDAQLLKHARISLGSANECEDELATLHRRGYLPAEDHDLLQMVRRLCAMLAGLIRRVAGDAPAS